MKLTRYVFVLEDESKMSIGITNGQFHLVCEQTNVFSFAESEITEALTTMFNRRRWRFNEDYKTFSKTRLIVEKQTIEVI